jgi:c-di-GMP-binding flagellar brake protein YcgR
VIRGILEIVAALRHSRENGDPDNAALGRDRRFFQRIPVRIAVKMKNRVYGLEAQGTLVDLSLGGAGFIVPVNWPEGSHVRLRLEGLDFEADTIVVFRIEEAANFHYGVQFKRLQLGQAYKLRRILRDRHSGPLSL